MAENLVSRARRGDLRGIQFILSFDGALAGEQQVFETLRSAFHSRIHSLTGIRHRNLT